MDNEKFGRLKNSVFRTREALAVATIERKRAVAAEDEARALSRKAETEYFEYCAMVAGITTEVAHG